MRRAVSIPKHFGLYMTDYCGTGKVPVQNFWTKIKGLFVRTGKKEGHAI